MAHIIFGIALLIFTNPISAQSLDKLGFGAGISITIDTGSTDRIDSASLVSGIVRADVESQTQSRAMLETHYFFKPQGKFLGLITVPGWGWGPFIGVVPGDDEIITAVSLGVMVGFKRKPDDANDNSSWNLGLGWVVDPKVKTLGDGIMKNATLPAGETDIRFKEQTQQGWGLVFSASF